MSPTSVFFAKLFLGSALAVLVLFGLAIGAIFVCGAAR